MHRNCHTQFRTAFQLETVSCLQLCKRWGSVRVLGHEGVRGGGIGGLMAYQQVLACKAVEISAP